MKVRSITGTVYKHEADLIDATGMGEMPGSHHVVGYVTVTAIASGESHSWRVLRAQDAPAIGSSVTLTIEVPE